MGAAGAAENMLITGTGAGRYGSKQAPPARGQEEGCVAGNGYWRPGCRFFDGQWSLGGI